MIRDIMSQLFEEVEAARLKIHTDSYPMSIGELVSLYEDEDLEIHPEFQRVFRWGKDQKSKLIESILLGIPLPSVFVSQRNDGVWDVVDGLQRISTILSFMGKMKDENGKLMEPLTLSSTKYLKNLEGKVWDASGDDKSSEVSSDIKRIFKREKINITIIKRESEEGAKFELFQRLNTGGTKLSRQEVRNCMLLMENELAFSWLKSCSSNEDFKKSISVSDRKEDEAYADELVIRFLVLRNYPKENRNPAEDVGDSLDSQTLKIISPELNFDFNSEKLIFDSTFKAIYDSLEDLAFKKINMVNDKRQGPINIPLYDFLCYGVSKYIEKNAGFNPRDLKSKISEWSEKFFKNDKYIEAVAIKKRPVALMNVSIEVADEIAV